MRKAISFLLIITCFGSLTMAQNIQNNPGSNHGNKFEQLGTIMPTPNEYRAASGAPGPKYWQQRCDYDIKCELDEKNFKLNGSETITYFNNSRMAVWKWIAAGSLRPKIVSSTRPVANERWMASCWMKSSPPLTR